MEFKFESQEASARSDDSADSVLALPKALVRSREVKEGAFDGAVHGFLYAGLFTGVDFADTPAAAPPAPGCDAFTTAGAPRDGVGTGLVSCAAPFA